MLVASSDYIGDIVYISYCERSEGRLAELLFYVFVVGGAEPQEGGGIARAWIAGSEGAPAPKLR